MDPLTHSQIVLQFFAQNAYLYSECSAKYSALPQTRGATHQVKQLLAHRLVIQAELQLRVQCADLHREHFTRLLSSKQAHF